MDTNENNLYGEHINLPRELIKGIPWEEQLEMDCPKRTGKYRSVRRQVKKMLNSLLDR